MTIAVEGLEATTKESGVKPQPTEYCPDFIGRPAFADNQKRDVNEG